MLDKKRGYHYHRPFYNVDDNVNIMAGMIAFLATNAAGVTVATTAASGTVPIGTFWQDRSASLWRTTVETGTFNANNIITLSKGNVRNTASIRVTDSTGAVVYTQGTDYTVSLTNGVVTRMTSGTTTAGQAVIITYVYNLTVGQEHWDLASTQWSSGVNYDRQPDDTLGSGQITVVESDAKLYTDQYDPNSTYTLNAALYSDNVSRWTPNANRAVSSRCGRVIKLPTAADPFLGLDQIRVVV